MIISASSTTNGSTSPLSPATIAVNKSSPLESNGTPDGCSGCYQLNSESTEPNGSSVAVLTPRARKELPDSDLPHLDEVMSPSLDGDVFIDASPVTSDTRTGSQCLGPLSPTSASLAVSCSSSLISSKIVKVVDLETPHLGDDCMTSDNRRSNTSAAVSLGHPETGPSSSVSTEHTTNNGTKAVSIASKRPLIPALKRRSGPESCLRKPLVSSGAIKARPSTGRRVSGLWNPVVQSSPTSSSSAAAPLRNSFEGLQDDTLELILSFLSMGDWLKCAMVDRRWNYMTQRDSLWKLVDASDFCREAHEHFAKNLDTHTATRLTSEALDKAVKRYTSVVSSLSIRSIGSSLSAEWFLPTASSLHELTLSGFEDLTDTHIHVMLLAGGDHGLARRSMAGNPLRKLVLEDCPLLTSASLRSIAAICPNLEELSLKGSGRKNPNKLDDMTPIADLLMISPKMMMPGISMSNKVKNSSNFQLSKRAADSQGSAPSVLSLPSLFGGPPPTKIAPSPLSRSSNLGTAPGGLSLQSLFGGPPTAKVAAAPASARSTSGPLSSSGASALQSLFGGPPPAKSPSSAAPSVKSCLSQRQLPQPPAPQLASLFAPPPVKSQTSCPPDQSPPRPKQEEQPLNALTSLFAPPGTSPRRRTPQAPVLPTMQTSGKLVRLDFRETPISADAFIACLAKAAASTLTNSILNNPTSQYCIHLESLHMNGSTWTDSYLHELGCLLALDYLQELDLAVSPATNAPSTSSTKLTNAGLAEFVATGSSCSPSTTSSSPCLSKLRRINLEGHNQINPEDVAASLMPVAPHLDTITV